jgi:hypothetical protein
MTPGISKVSQERGDLKEEDEGKEKLWFSMED